MKPRKPRVLWAICFPASIDQVSVCRKEMVQRLEDCRGSGMKGGSLVRFVEASRRKAKRSPRGRTPSHEEHVKAHKDLLKARKAGRRK